MLCVCGGKQLFDSFEWVGGKLSLFDRNKVKRWGCAVDEGEGLQRRSEPGILKAL